MLCRYLTLPSAGQICSLIFTWAVSASHSCVQDSTQQQQNGEEPLLVPEDIGKAAAQLLLEEINRGGVVDGTHQALLLTLAAMGPEEVNQVGTRFAMCCTCQLQRKRHCCPGFLD